MKKSNLKGYIHSIDTYSTLDGFGIRSVVFMQGCDLRCIYCHNPDTWNKANGTAMTTSDIVAKIKSYIAYYGAKGGVTFGGGEPLKQAEFVSECVSKLNALGVKSCIETSGNVELTDDVKTLLNKLDFVICDLKFATKDDYKKYANGDIDRTINFLQYLQRNNIPTWIRTVVVPELNDNEEALNKYKEIINSFDNIIKWELLPLSKLGFEKYTALNIPNKLKDCIDLNMDNFIKLQKKFEFEKEYK